MTITLAFDVYGTLIDTHGVIVELEKHIGARAADFSQTWRNKQLEYSFRRGLMQQYKDFSVCTNDAFKYTCLYYKAKLSDKDKQGILNTYKILPAFDDVIEGLDKARSEGFSLYAFSNGSAEAVESLLSSAAIKKYFLDVVSVDEVKSFKPNPVVYQHYLSRTGSVADKAWLVSRLLGLRLAACGQHGCSVLRTPFLIHGALNLLL
jgi:2-haloacid dehalogenase